MTRPRPHNAGYLLLETMVALAIVSVGLLAVMGGLRVSMSAARHAACVTTASQLAQQKLAEFRAVGPDTVGVREGDFAPDFPAYRWRTSIAPVPNETFYSVLVDVWWDEQGQRKSLSLPSLLRIEAGPS